MTNSTTLTIDKSDGSTLDVIIQTEHVDEKGYGVQSATIFTIWATTDWEL